MDGFSPIKGKCTFWREMCNADDEYDTRINKEDKRVNCSCFVEGHGWTFRVVDVPSDCPNARKCRYYIRVG